MFILNNVKYKNILDITSLLIPSDKIVIIQGESGSGKSTLLRLLNKLISPENGNISYNGTSLKELDSVYHRKNVVMSSQAAVMFKGNIRDNILLPLNINKKSPIEDSSIMKLLETVHLKKDLDTNCDILSGGEKQRVALARALALTPEVLLLDEPTSALDSSTEEGLMEDLIKYCKDKNISLIIITHSKAVSASFAEYMIELSSGKVVFQGEVA
ncbi:MAG: ABC transporter ATP-binding protein [Clostridiaceae bacterium]